MAGEKRYTRIPPESTGDRVYMIHTAEIEFINKGSYDASSSYEWVIGAMYDIEGFGMVHVHGAYDRGDGTGILSVHYSKQAKFDNLEPTVNNKIRFDIDNDDLLENVADVSSFYDLYVPAQHIMGYDNPEYGVDVDVTGSMNMRFAEGLPQLDAWGKLRISGATHLGDYVFGQQEKLTDNFALVGFDGGAVEWNQDRKSARIRINPSPTAPEVFNAANAFAAATSHTYHHYFPGSSHLYMATAALNNPTQTGSVRRWGMFDADNGFFFLLGTGGSGASATDTTGFCAVIRNNASAAIGFHGGKDLIIPRDDWNGDKLDGSGDSQTSIDLSKDNIWWIDVQWHGSGRVRFGTYIDGQRIVCHSYYHGNQYEFAMTQTTSLPVCFSNQSTASTTQDLYVETWSASVWTETTKDLHTAGKPVTYGSPHYTVTANIDSDWQYLFSLSPEELIDTGVVNHSLYMPTALSAYSFDNGVVGSTKSGELDAIIDIKAEINSVHTGHDFSRIPNTTVDVSTSGSNYENGRIILQDMFRGRLDRDWTDIYNNFQYGSVKNFSEDGGIQENTISAITEAATAEITVSDPVLLLREPQQANFPLNISRYAGKVEILGSTNASYNGTFYIKITSATTAELYNDYDLNTGVFSNPVDSSAFGAFTGTALLKGFYGSRLIWSFYAKTRTALHDQVKLMLNVSWKEIIQ